MDHKYSCTLANGLNPRRRVSIPDGLRLAGQLDHEHGFLTVHLSDFAGEGVDRLRGRADNLNDDRFLRPATVIASVAAP